MIRAPMGDQAYWDKWAKFSEENILKDLEQLKGLSRNPGYRPQFVWDLSKEYPRQILTRYSRGDAISELGQHFLGLLDAWELSNKLAAELNAQLQPGQGWDHRRLLGAPQVSDDSRSHNDPRSWVFDLTNLNHYNWCFWL
ncbi:PoNe immunity protein domain-containing protein, partial [Parvibium lacunae]